MRIIRYLNSSEKKVLAAITVENRVYDLPYHDFLELVRAAEEKKVQPVTLVEQVIEQSLPLSDSPEKLKVLVPVEAPEVWASGVTYEKSKEARNYESTNGEDDAKSFYDKVYTADRPELFFKSTADRTIGPGDPVYLRSDSEWQIPEPELGLVLDSEGNILGFTAGNDMSCRDIEGENPLYLPQAKIWRHSCVIGPAIRLVETVKDPYDFQITCRIFRNEQNVFEGSASVGQLKRRLEELTSYLVKENVVFPGTILLTGTCIVPPNDFTLLEGDYIEIEIPGIGVLSNPVLSQVTQSIGSQRV
ncbi:fumarylacetoacetate hydrolase family protein [Alkalihalobacillus sp. AL-G]|uniref:fumarylacetoacetate hydrolase family protein n=1 Tax=Alkalihalobacillus sp. AL-G TaxID=2926399 RepID=UPI00272C9AC0|nr:fumarylacetoacetate hydrolase family protein [Alkalihalobacillus sp. AL-G]WLD93845.1 fumarylacetoacetate hydrolase family protein [Alkalihalobacillus sp. AL-G]